MKVKKCLYKKCQKEFQSAYKTAYCCRECANRATAEKESEITKEATKNKKLAKRSFAQIKKTRAERDFAGPLQWLNGY